LPETWDVQQVKSIAQLTKSLSNFWSKFDKPDGVEALGD
jgi:hypothetical protein